MKQTHTNWYILVTGENFDEIYTWWKIQANKRRWTLCIGQYAMSEHPEDDSCYWNGSERYLNEEHPEYKSITIEQFREIVNSQWKNDDVSVTIPRVTLLEYWDAATTEQKEYLNNNVKLDGTTTVAGIRGLYNIACNKWKATIKANHPHCFPVESKYFDSIGEYRKSYGQKILFGGIGEKLGLKNDFIEIRNGHGEHGNHSFWLDPIYTWELIKDGDCQILVPSRK